jgi:predicted RNA-binding Zn ribbon-like protein
VDFSHYSDDPVQMAVDLVNTFEVAADAEHLSTADDVAEFVASHGEGWDPPTDPPTEADLHEIQALRSRLRAVFDASDGSEAAAVLNQILADVGAVPRLSLHGEHPHLHFEPENGSLVSSLGAITAMGLSVALIEGSFERFGTCASTTCDDAFVDTSKNRSRRHCSDTCTTRENVAAYRERKRRE